MNEAKQRMYKSKSNIVINLNVLKKQLSKDDYNTLISITDNTKEKTFYIHVKKKLISKYNSLKNTTFHLHIPVETTASTVKEGIVNLSGEELDENKVKHLNLGPKFVPTENRKRPYMDFIQVTEICALDLERKGKFSVAESLSIYPFDKGTGFVVIKEEDAIQKIDKQIGKSKVIHYDPTPTLLNKFLKELAKLRKESKFDNKTYFKLYPSYAIPPRLYGVIKAREKLAYDDSSVNYRNRTIRNIKIFS